jgi:diacylglycerol O-acyltransferase-1
MNNSAAVTGAQIDIITNSNANGTTTTGSNGVVHRSNTSQAQPNCKTDEATIQLRKSFIKKYRHVAAVHSETRPSTLSHDGPATPSFLGFRNLMVIMLGEYHWSFQYYMRWVH